MAQKKKVPAKSPAKVKPKVRAAASAKPMKKVESKAAPARKPSKSQAQPPAKAKSVPKKSAAATTSKAVGKAPAPVAKTATLKTAPKAADRKTPSISPAKKPAVATAQAKAVKPAPVKAPVAAAPVKPAVAPQPAPVKPVATATPPPGLAPGVAKLAQRPVVPQAGLNGATPPKAVAAPAMPQRTVSSALPKPAIRTFPAPGPAAAAAGVPRDIAQKAVDARQQQMASALAAAKKPVTARHGFKINESIVYPAHGVGRIIGIEEQEIAGMSLELFVIQFEKDKMTLRVPTGKLQSVGMRKLAEDDIVSKAMETLKGRARIKRTMWSRRAQEYETKINSGDLVSIAEVVRDLYRSESQPEQSYSERQLYEAALDRMAREIAAVARIDERGAVQRITEVLSKSAKGRRAAEAADSDSDGASDSKAA